MKVVTTISKIKSSVKPKIKIKSSAKPQIKIKSSISNVAKGTNSNNNIRFRIPPYENGATPGAIAG
ncbi:hypothetical protein HDV05_006593 [Chytridiales sp. JEL 0842]|nr:hypothetical protein HDV05_006593 [Chytridiales sp. JEL 0842]